MREGALGLSWEERSGLGGAAASAQALRPKLGWPVAEPGGAQLPGAELSGEEVIKEDKYLGGGKCFKHTCVLGPHPDRLNPSL